MTDVADEAAGEVIYSYDGDEDPAVVTQPPPIASGSAVEGGGMPSAPEAFETFAGKVYKPTSFTGAFAMEKETTLERLARLQKEMDLLEQDLSTTSDTASGTPNALLETIQDMKARLAKVAVIPPQDTLSANVNKAASMISSPTSPPATPSMGGGQSEFVSTSGGLLESRLQRLEQLIGSSSLPSSSSDNAVGSLSERLSSLEVTLSKLDEKELELKAKKAKVIRQDLEAASKARNKLMSGGAGSTSTSASDSQTISELHDLMTQLQGMTPHLPLLTQRLQALSRQHQEATLQAARLQSVVDLSQRLSSQVSSLEHAVQTTETALVQTAEQMKQNMQALDAKLK
mmetsp:Transcript_13273/g.36636  ORF Transcript_13273/g.36636 Transcript_13273/m.36636 type:complete len:344 (-) Transcript_13273:109-1140(-)